jgi:hypothetical protein
MPTAGLEPAKSIQQAGRLPLWDNSEHFPPRHNCMLCTTCSATEIEEKPRVLNTHSMVRYLKRPLICQWLPLHCIDAFARAGLRLGRRKLSDADWWLRRHTLFSANPTVSPSASTAALSLSLGVSLPIVLFFTKVGPRGR